MSGQVFNTVNAILGSRGTGKTVYMRGDAQLNVPGLIPKYAKKGMKVLIVDTMDHPAYRDIPIVTPKQMQTWGPSSDKTVRRVFVPVDDIPRLNKVINKYLWNALLVYEDAYKHQSERLDQSIKEIIGDSKQKNIDLVFMYHTWMHAPLDLYRYLDAIEVFKTKDSPEARRSTIMQAGYWPDAIEIYTKVKAHEKRFHHLTLSTGL